jgi:phage terminase large subunit-like protein
MRQAFLQSLSANDAEILYRDWAFWARSEQLAPDGDWRIWLFMGGRGAGKTRAGAEWILDGVRKGTMRRVALLGATYADVRDVMVKGESGLLGIGRGDGIRYEPSKRQMHWPSGAIAHAFTAEEPDGLRGHQFDGAWFDGRGRGRLRAHLHRDLFRRSDRAGRGRDAGAALHLRFACEFHHARAFPARAFCRRPT